MTKGKFKLWFWGTMQQLNTFLWQLFFGTEVDHHHETILVDDIEKTITTTRRYFVGYRVIQTEDKQEFPLSHHFVKEHNQKEG